jgi:hypothetical protein
MNDFECKTSGQADVIWFVNCEVRGWVSESLARSRRLAFGEREAEREGCIWLRESNSRSRHFCSLPWRRGEATLRTADRRGRRAVGGLRMLLK